MMSRNVHIFIILILIAAMALYIQFIGLMLKQSSAISKRFGNVRSVHQTKSLQASRTPTEIITTVTEISGECFKQVYIWLDPSDQFHVDLIVRGRVGEFPCAGLRCGVRIVYGNDLEKLEESDIIFLFYKSSWDWDTLMRHRRSDQKWIFWTSESARHTHSRVIPPPNYTDIYDYVMTYRTSELIEPGATLLGTYGEYHDQAVKAANTSSGNWAENKTALVALVSTNCFTPTLSWKRDDFVSALSRHIDVDMYGPCGSQECEALDKCGLQRYKFYLAFENSECREYITEKFWYNSLTLGLVPVVYGAPKEDYLKVAPPNSFIHVQDFTSISELANYLKEVDRNDEMYNRYFEWRKQGSVTYHIQFSNFEPDYLCNIVLKKVMADERRDAVTGSRRAKPIVRDWPGWWTYSCRSDHGDPPIVID